MSVFRSRKAGLELLIALLTISPFVYLALDWHPSIAHSAAGVFGYFFTSALFYFFSVWFTLLDSRRHNREHLWASTRQIRIIWAFFIAAVGWILFYHTLHTHTLDFYRLTGVLLALFLFASGNFQGRLHPSSAFAGNRTQLATPDARFRRGQRLYATIKFWAGLAATVIFLTAQPSQLILGYLLIAFSIIYGLIFRFLKQ